MMTTCTRTVRRWAHARWANAWLERILVAAEAGEPVQPIIDAWLAEAETYRTTRKRSARRD